jgi:hypothetical protein
MQAVQRMRVKAQSTGQLKSTPEQVVKTEVDRKQERRRD